MTFLLFLSTHIVAQSIEKESTAVIELGAAADRSLTEGHSSFENYNRHPHLVSFRSRRGDMERVKTMASVATIGVMGGVGLVGSVGSEEEEAERADSSLEARLEKAMAEPDYEREEIFQYLKEYRKQERFRQKA